MYNTDLPRRADLPTSAQLKRSTWIAGITASAILAFVVLPSEYAVDPTGIGRVLGLTQMGEIKTQLALEATQDAAATKQADGVDLSLDTRLDRIETMLKEFTQVLPALPVGSPDIASSEASVPPASERVAEQPAAKRLAAAPSEAPQEVTSEWRDEVSFNLAPGEGVEVKLVMEQGAQAEFHWTANGAVVNYDTHGDGGGNAVSYEKGRGVSEQEGVLEAAFPGNHGWFWRNRTGSEMTLTLGTRGAYSDLKRMM